MKFKIQCIKFILIFLPIFISYTEVAAVFGYKVYILNKIIKAFVFIFLLLKLILRIRVTNYRFLFSVALFFAWIFITTVIKSGSIVKYFGFLSTWGIILLCFELYSKKYYEKIIDALFLLYTLFMSINIIGMIANFNSTINNIGTYFFLGMDNTIPAVILPCVVLSLANPFKKENHKNNVVVYNLYISILSILLTFSATGYVGLAVLFGTIFLTSIKKEIKLYYALLVIYILVFYILVLGPARELFKSIANILNKADTFSARFWLWDDAISLIKENWFFGLGIGKTDNIILNMNLGLMNRHAHQQILQIGFYGGITAIVLFFNIIYSYFKVVKESIKNKIYDNFIVVVSAGIYAFMIMGLNEVYGQMTTFAFLTCIGSYYVKVHHREKSIDNV